MKHYWKILAVFVALFVTNYVSYAQTAEQINKELTSLTFQMGVKKYITQQPSEASIFFDKTIQLTDSAHSPSLYYKAITISGKEPDKALYLITKATKVWNDNISFLEAKAQLQNRLFKYKEAEKTYTKLYKLTPNSPYYTYYCTVLAAVNGDFYKANEFASEYEAKFGFHEKIYDVRYDYFLRNNKIDSLNEYVKKTFNNQPNSPIVIAHFGKIMSSEGNDVLALDAFNKAIKLDPSEPKFYMSLIDFHLTHKNYEELLATTEELFNLDGIRAEFKINLVNELLRYIEPHGEYKERLIDITKIIVTKDPDNTVALKFYTGLLSFVNQNEKAYSFLKEKYDKGELKEDMLHTFLMYVYNSEDKYIAMSVASKFLKIYPENIDINNFMLALLSINKEYKKLSKLAVKIINFTQNDSVKSMVYVTKASATEHISTINKTIGDFENAIKYDPNNAMALNNYAYFLAQQSSNLEQALELATKAIKIEPKDVNYIDTKAWVYFKLGMYNEANSLMIQLLSITNIISDEVTVHLGDILFAKGSELLAKNKWRSVKDKTFEKAINERLLLKSKDVDGLLKIINKYE